MAEKIYNLKATNDEDAEIVVDGLEKRGEAVNTAKTLKKAGYTVKVIEVSTREIEIS